MLHVQLVGEERELALLRNSFTADFKVKEELDEIAGSTTESDRYTLQHVLALLRIKRWNVEEVTTVGGKKYVYVLPSVVFS